MFQLVIYDYNKGIKKISFTRLIKQQAGASLSEAKRALDMFLEGRKLVFNFNRENELRLFKHKAELLGVKSKLGPSLNRIHSNRRLKSRYTTSSDNEVFISVHAE